MFEATGPDRFSGAMPALDGASFALLDPAALGFDELAQWDELAAASGGANIFAEPWLMRQSLEYCDSIGKARLAVVRDPFGRWAGVLPVASANRYGRVPILHWEAWRHPNQFTSSPLVRAGSEEFFWSELLSGLAHAEPGRAMLRLYDLPMDEPATGALQAICDREGRPVKCDQARSRALLHGDRLAGVSWRERLKPDHRRRICGLDRKLERTHGSVTFGASRDAARLTRKIEEFLQLEASGWKAEAGSAIRLSCSNQQFVRGMAQAAGEIGALEAAWLAVDEKVIAISLHLIDRRGCGHGFKMTFDEHYSDCAPGLLLLARLTDHFVASGLQWVDSCSAPDQQPVGRLWPDRREFLDCGVALGTMWNWRMVRGVIACERLVHRMQGKASVHWRVTDR